MLISIILFLAFVAVATFVTFVKLIVYMLRDVGVMIDPVIDDSEPRHGP
jgi:hypothetical protein